MLSGPLPRHTGRVLLRRLEPSDLPLFQGYRRDPEVGLYQGWEPQSDADSARFIDEMNAMPLFPRGAWMQLGIADPATGQLIGDLGVCISADGSEAEIGFTLARQSQGQGVGAEAVRELAALIFAHTPAARILAIVDQRNVRARRLLTRLGFHEGNSVTAVFRGQPCIEQEWTLPRPAQIIPSSLT